MAAINNFFFSSKSVEGASASSGASTGASSSNFYVSGINFNTSSGDLTLNRVGLSDLIVNLDDRYLELTGGTLTGALTVSSGDVTVSNGNLAVIGNVTGDNLNISNWDAAYNDKINSASFSGGATNTLTLTQQDGGTVTASFDNTYLTGGSFSNGDLTLNRTFGGSVVIDLDNTNHFEVQSNKGAANGYTPLDSSGLIPQAYLPPVTITETFVVASEAAQLALTAQQGDVAVRTDLNKSYILQGTDPSVLGDWQELLSPTDAVQSVNGLAGAVTLDLGFSSGTLSLTGSGATVDLDNWFDTAFGLKTTDNLSEGSTNLYFADSRARGALSFTAGSGAYNSTTGVITIPTNNNQITNGANYITASSADTLTNKSGNISQWTNDAGYLTSFSETDTLDSVTDRGNTTTNAITVGGATINGTTNANGAVIIDTSTNRMLRLDGDFATGGFSTTSYYRQGTELWRQVIGSSNEFSILSEESGSNTRLTILQNGNVGIGTSNPSAKFHVKGASNYDGVITADNSGSLGGGIFAVRKQGTVAGTLTVEGSVLGTSSTNLALFAETGNDLRFYTNGSGTLKFYIGVNGDLQAPHYGGGGNRIMLTDNAGNLKAAVIGTGLAFDGTTLTASGTISGSGTSGKLTKWTGATAIGDSIITEVDSNSTRITGSSYSQLLLKDPSEAVDNREWAVQNIVGLYRIRALNDAFTSGQNAYVISRTGINVDEHLLRTDGVTRLTINSSGATFQSLSGSGNRVAIADANGKLIDAVIGSGLSFDGTTLTASGGSGGTISGSGTSGKITKWTGATAIGNSIMEETGSTITVSGTVAATGGNSTEWNTAYDRSLNANPTFNTSTGTLSLPTQGVGSYTANLDGRYALLGSGATRVETLYSNFTQYATETVRASFSVSSAGVYILKGVVYVDASQNGRFSVRVGTSSTGSTATNRLPSNTSMVYDSSGSLDYSAIPFIFRVSLAAGTNYLFFINTSTPNGDPLASAPEQDRSVVNVTSFVEVVTEVQYLPPPPPM